MRIGLWNFQPALWPSLATLISFPILLSLGFWQLDRAAQKEQLLEEFESSFSAKAINLDADNIDSDHLSKLEWRQVSIHGHFESSKQFLLDNQIMNGKTGYFVYTPFKVEHEDKHFLVNRGWVAANLDRQILPDISLSEQPITISGTVKQPPKLGIVLSEELTESLDNGLLRLQRIDLDTIATFTDKQFFPKVIRLNKDSPEGYLRNWFIPGSGAGKNYGYAFQWFLMAIAVLILFFLNNFTKVRNDN